jgi:glycosyltransferase involved in cell wall biosynthesis
MRTSPELLNPRNSRPRRRHARLLLFSYHFPPGDSTGALRWQKLASYAVQRGWHVDVITRHPDEASLTDSERLAGLPDGIRVFAVRSPTPSLLQWERRAAQWLRRIKSLSPARNGKQSAGVSSVSGPAADLVWREHLGPFRLPQLRAAYRAWRFFEEEAAWAKAAAAAAREIFNGHAAVVSCGPPHMPHVAACEAAKQFGVPFVMDMRDPWSLTPALPTELATGIWYKLAERFERAVVNSAALVVANTGALAAAMKTKYPQAGARIITVMNGCDDQLIERQANGRFIVCFAGNIYIDRDPRLVFRAFAEFVRRTNTAPAEVGIELVGHVEQYSGTSVQSLAEQVGIADYLAVYPRVPRTKALEIMSRAAVLLSLPQEVHLAIPSKIFDYMQFPALLVALAQRRSATAELLEGSSAVVVAPDDMEKLTATLCGAWRDFQAGCLPKPVNADGRFGRKHQANILFDAIDGICRRS